MKTYEIARDKQIEGWFGATILKAGMPVDQVHGSVRSGEELSGIVVVSGKKMRVDFVPKDLREAEPELLSFIEKKFLEVV